MSQIKYYTTIESKAKDTSIAPIKDGQFLIVTDTMKLMYDFGTKRIVLGDIIELDTEVERTALLAPLAKFYFVKATGVLWRYNNGSWIEWDNNVAADHINTSIRSNDGVHGLRFNSINSTLEVKSTTGETWSRVPVTISGDAVSCTLLASAWENGSQTVSVSGLSATQNGIVGAAQNLTETQLDAIGAAKLCVSGQANGTLTIVAYGEVPEIDIPITVLLF